MLENLWELYREIPASAPVKVEVPAEAVRMQGEVDTTPAQQLSPFLRATDLMRVPRWSRPKEVMLATHAAKRLDKIYAR